MQILYKYVIIELNNNLQAILQNNFLNKELVSLNYVNII
jgi:hypothetical protein